MNKHLQAAIVVSISAISTGCGSMSGLEASSSFSCKAAPGVNCQSISGVHQNASAGNLPFQRAESAKPQDTEKVQPYTSNSQQDGKVSPKDMAAQYSGMPVRQPPLVLRIWMSPYEDETGDLHDQSYFYTMVHSGKWMIEANRRAVTNQYMPIYPLNRSTQSDQGQSEKETHPLTQKQQYENLVEKPNPQ